MCCDLSSLLSLKVFHAGRKMHFSRYGIPEIPIAPFLDFVNLTSVRRKDQVLQIWLDLEK